MVVVVWLESVWILLRIIFMLLAGLMSGFLVLAQSRLQNVGEKEKAVKFI